MKSIVFVLLLVTYLAFAVFAEKEQLSGKEVWEAYRSQLISFFTRGRDSGSIQILTKPIEATYDLEGNEEALENFLNQVVEVGPVRKVKEESLLPSDFFEFLNNIKLDKISPEAKSAIDAAASKLEATKVKYNEFQKTCETRYLKVADRMSFEKFAERFCLMNSLEDELMTDQALYELAVARAGGSTQDVVKTLDEFAKFAKSERFPWVEPFSSLSHFRKEIASDRGNSFKIQISKTSLNQEKSNKNWETDSELDEPIVKAEGSKTYTFTTSTDLFKMNIEASAYKVLDVEPEKWFSQEVLQNHAEGPFKSKKVAAEFFGEEGKLNMIPKKLYLIYRPTVTMQVGQNDAEYFKTVKSVTIGPFKGNPFVKKERTIDIVDKSGSTITENVYTVTVKSMDEHPQIVAVDYELN